MPSSENMHGTDTAVEVPQARKFEKLMALAWRSCGLVSRAVAIERKAVCARGLADHQDEQLALDIAGRDLRIGSRSRSGLAGS
jgi:hypothetical protein